MKRVGARRAGARCGQRPSVGATVGCKSCGPPQSDGSCGGKATSVIDQPAVRQLVCLLLPLSWRRQLTPGRKWTPFGRLRRRGGICRGSYFAAPAVLFTASTQCCVTGQLILGGGDRTPAHLGDISPLCHRERGRVASAPLETVADGSADHCSHQGRLHIAQNASLPRLGE